MTASGVVQVAYVANVDAKEQDQLENVKFVCGSLAIFSLGRLCEEMVCSNSWKSGGRRQLITDGATVESYREKSEPLVAVTRHQEALA